MSRQRRMDGVEERLVAGLDRDVDRAAVEVQLPDGVADRGRRLADRQVVLPVAAPEPARAEQPPAAPLDERRREVEPAPLPGDPVQLDEGHLDLRVAVDHLAPVRTERPLDGGSRTLGDEEETIVAERTVPGDGRLDEMADAVELVAPLEILVLAARPRGPGRRC